MPTAAHTDRGRLAIVFLVVAAACDRGPSEFRCRAATQCVLGATRGACEPDGHCSFADPDCPAGRRYGRHAPTALANRCVEAPRCGDGRLSPGEECDDGNTADDDGCTSRCVRCGTDLGAARFAWPQNGACYVRQDEPSTWTAAERSCAAMGGHLVTFTSIYEESAVYRALLPEARDGYWIGFAHRPPLDDFTWITSEPRLVSRWAMGQPPPLGPAPSCVAVTPVAGPDGVAARSWNAGDCNHPRPYVCERPPAAVRPGDGHVYRGIFLPLGWDQARDACAAAGAHLAVITSAEEQAFVTAAFYGGAWLGATDRETEGVFRWLTGEPFAFQRFAPGEPDDYGGIHDCLMLAEDRLWHDRPCGERAAALCETE